MSRWSVWYLLATGLPNKESDHCSSEETSAEGSQLKKGGNVTLTEHIISLFIVYVCIML